MRAKRFVSHAVLLGMGMNLVAGSRGGPGAKAAPIFGYGPND